MLFEVIFDSVKKVITVCQGRYTDGLDFHVGEEVTMEDLRWLRKEGWKVNPPKWEAYSGKGRVSRNLLAT